VTALASTVNNVLDDPAWTAAAAVFAGLALVLTFVYRQRRSRKVLARALETTPVVSVHAEAADKVSLIIDGHEVETAHLLTLKLANLGTLPIQGSDFERPIAINLGPNGSTLDIQVTDVVPPDLKPRIRIEGNLIYLDPLLLNPGDSLSIKALVQDLTPEATLEARIVGIPRLIDFGSWEGMTFHQRARTFYPAITAVAALLLSVTALTLTWIALKTGSDDFTIRLKDGTVYCADELAIEPTVMHLRLSGTGELLSFPLRKYESIDPDSC
jgi:preprotein translocase subunit SecG